MLRLCAATALACVMLIPTHAVAQEGYAPPRTADGRPDFGGVWTNSEHRVEATFDPPEDQLPFIDRAAAMAWREKYANYMSGRPQPDFTQGVDTLPNRDRCLMAANAAGCALPEGRFSETFQRIDTA